MAVWLVGEHNPKHADPRFALYPLPPQCAGGRLARALGLGPREYLSRFPERRNLLPHTAEKWSAPVARGAADALLLEHPAGAGLVLCGARVSRAFGVDYARSRVYLTPEFVQLGAGSVLRGRHALVIPHPSGLSRAWNDPSMAPRVRAAVKELEERCAGS